MIQNFLQIINFSNDFCINLFFKNNNVIIQKSLYTYLYIQILNSQILFKLIHLFTLKTLFINNSINNPISFNPMRLADLLIDRSVPEWSRCYYDYQGAKIFTKYANKKMKLCRHSQQQYLLSQSQQHLKPSKFSKPQPRPNLQQQLINSVHQSNQKFIKYHILNKDIVFLFSQMKLHQLFLRLQKYEQWVTKIKFTKQSFEFLLYNVYSESKMLYRMCEVNQMAYKNIKAIHVKAYEQQFGIEYCKMSDMKRIQRTMEELEKYFVRLENLYMITDKPLPKRMRSQSYQQIAPNQLKQSISSYIFGLTNGFSVSLIILSIIIYSISQINSYSPRFARDFPTWRAIIYIILHMWAFALSTIIFQKYKINYSLIFGGNHMKQRSSFALYISSFFTFLCMILFVIYLLHLTGLIDIESEVVYCFPAIIWGVILVCIILPLPILHHKGRLEFFKQILKTLVSPLFHVHFNVIFMTEQFISHILPFSDVVYTICYYTHANIGDMNQQICSNYLYSAQYFGIVIFSYRLIQSLKVAYQNNAFLNTREMYICIRSSLNMFIIVISLLSTIERSLMIVWIVFAVPICFFNYYVDLKWDWGLLEIWGEKKVDNENLEDNNQNKGNNNNNNNNQHNQQHDTRTSKRFLRNFITFKPIQYYFIMLINLTFRFISLLAISENIIYQTKIKPLYLIFAIACIQIIRRLFWNILKVQREHVINCQKFRVKKYYHENQENIKKQLRQRYENNNNNNNNEQIQSNQNSLQKLRRSQEIKNLQEQIERKIQMKGQIQKWREYVYEKIEKVEKQIQEKYRKQQEEKLKRKKNK